MQFVEIDKFCQKVLAKNFPGVPIHDDIKTFTYALRGGCTTAEPITGNDERFRRESLTEGSRWKEKDSFIERPFLLTGGFPCQPFSCAGKQRGTDDARYLWPEMLRVIREAQPTYIIGENVAGLINMAEFDSELEVDSEANLFGDVTIKSVKRGRGILDRIICQLEEIGYQVQAFIIPACAVNAPHRRDRVWIVGNATGERGTAKIGEVCKGEGSDSNGSTRHVAETNSGRLEGPASQRRDGQYAFREDSLTPDPEGGESGEPRAGNGREDIGGRNREINTNPVSEGLQGSEPRQPLRLPRQPDRSRCDQKPDWSENWLEVATRLCRVDDGLPRQVDRVNRLKALGNAIVPQVAYEIMKAIPR